MSLWLVLLGVADYCYADYWYTAAMSMHWSQYSTPSSAAAQVQGERTMAPNQNGKDQPTTHIYHLRGPLRTLHGAERTRARTMRQTHICVCLLYIYGMMPCPSLLYVLYPCPVPLLMLLY